MAPMIFRRSSPWSPSPLTAVYHSAICTRSCCAGGVENSSPACLSALLIAVWISTSLTLPCCSATHSCFLSNHGMATQVFVRMPCIAVVKFTLSYIAYATKLGTTHTIIFVPYTSHHLLSIPDSKHCTRSASCRSEGNCTSLCIIYYSYYIFNIAFVSFL